MDTENFIIQSQIGHLIYCDFSFLIAQLVDVNTHNKMDNNEQICYNKYCWKD